MVLERVITSRDDSGDIELYITIVMLTKQCAWDIMLERDGIC